MASNDKRTEDLLDRLTLEIKAVSLLYGSETELREKLEGRITESHDESVRRFVKAIQGEKPKETGSLLVIALGELVMASLLVVAGAVALVPAVVGVSSIAGLLQYLAERTSGSLGWSPLSPYLSFVEFAVGLALMLSAFFALREAALNLKEAGLAIKSGEG